VANYPSKFLIISHLQIFIFIKLTYLQKLACLFLIYFSGQFIFGQESLPVKRIANTIRIANAPKIDGTLDDGCWMSAAVQKGFTQSEPNPAKPASEDTDVKIIYDDKAIYIGAVMHVSNRDSIFKQITKRDENDNADFFGVVLDTYKDGINGLDFIVTSAGVQVDLKISSNGEDDAWNAVWQSAVQINNDSWVAEIKIPYSALRFPDKEIQEWGLNFIRSARVSRQTTWWNLVDNKIEGYINQSGILKGIENIDAPVRLFFSPYVSGYIDHYPERGVGKKDAIVRLNGGMDVKYGLNDAFTLDMTLVPDFGQVQSDNQVLNLSPFEIQFNENRQFFTEGTELFSKAGLFYSRRIGGSPFYIDNLFEKYNNVKTYPTTSKLINASKLSGRNAKGLGIGVFNAVTRRAYATVESEEGQSQEVLIDPFTNYNIFVLDQNLNNNSYVSFVNTNVYREGMAYEANVTGVEFDLKTKNLKYSLNGNSSLSQKYFTNFTDLGYTYGVAAEKIQGNFTYGISNSVESKSYDRNDLGYLEAANSINSQMFLNYNIFEPFGKFNTARAEASIYNNRLYSPNTFTETGFNLEGNMGTRKFFYFGGFMGGEPYGGYDFFEPRVDGRYFKYVRSYYGGCWISTDYRKKIAIDLEIVYSQQGEKNRNGQAYNISPRFRFNDHFTLIYRLSYETEKNNIGYASKNGEFANEVLVGNNFLNSNDILFGKRDETTYENTLSVNYIFNNKSGITLRARHYWSTVDYNLFYTLKENGELNISDYTGKTIGGSSGHNNSFNAFNIDMVYSWVFSPGSELSIVWKDAIYQSDYILPKKYFKDLNDTVLLPQNNSLSLKLLYFIDYLWLKPKKTA
jgi:Domain of unknown function (DUF5916)